MTDEPKTGDEPRTADGPVTADTPTSSRPAPSEERTSHEEPEAAEPSSPVPPADVPPPPVELPPAFPRRPFPVVPALLATTGVLLVLVILLGLMAFAPRIAPIKTSATKLAANALEEETIQAVARRFARNFVTVDYRTIDEDLERMSVDATGNFRDQLDRTIRAIGEEFKKRKARSTGRALDSAVLSHEGSTALVQVLLRRTKQNVGTKGPETGNQIVNVSLVRTDEGWKVDNLSQLGGEEP